MFSVTNLITLQLVILSAKAATLEQKINQPPDESAKLIENLDRNKQT